ncbi:MAG: serine/threonine-protein phosphatase [Melioribacteraceae bacterium]|nr:serine/threonine-protein phosphatase [Melioribacteraceae bacterium]
MKYSGSKKRLFTRQFWKTIELKYFSLFLLAVFFMFSSMGFVGDLFSELKYSYPALISGVLISGLLSAGYAYAATRRLWALPIILIAQFLYIFYLRSDNPTELAPEFIKEKAIVVGLGIMLSVMLGYTFFVTFITRVGINHFLLKAEMDLAKGIHDVLVPEINIKTHNFQVYGKSNPATEVGGDLVDFVQMEKTLYCAIADVSGHGVSSGVYTGMFKSSLRVSLQQNKSLGEIISDVNNTLMPLTKKNMFITSTILKFFGENKLEFTVAGHLPILHYNSETMNVDELTIKQIPVGVKTNFPFNSKTIDYKPNDIFVLLTDGITETADKSNKLLGIDEVKKIIRQNAGGSAESICNSILRKVNDFGQQNDDITLLAVKCQFG